MGSPSLCSLESKSMLRVAGGASRAARLSAGPTAPTESSGPASRPGLLCVAPCGQPGEGRLDGAAWAGRGGHRGASAPHSGPRVRKAVGRVGLLKTLISKSKSHSEVQGVRTLIFVYKFEGSPIQSQQQHPRICKNEYISPGGERELWTTASAARVVWRSSQI